MVVAQAHDSSTQIPVRDPDVRLMLEVRDEIPGSFERLVDRYQARLVGVLYHMIGSMEEAEDIAQEVFLRIYRSRKGYRPTAKFSTWLFTIANNLALNAIRNRKRKPTNRLPTTNSSGVDGRPLEKLVASPSGAMPSRVFAKAEMAECVRNAVQQLSEDQRMAVILNKFEDLNYQQIAEIMKKSEMAVKSLLSRARSALREILEPYIETPDPKSRPQSGS